MGSQSSTRKQDGVTQKEFRFTPPTKQVLALERKKKKKKWLPKMV